MWDHGSFLYAELPSPVCITFWKLDGNSSKVFMTRSRSTRLAKGTQ